MPLEIPTADESAADERDAEQGEHADEEVDRTHHLDLLESLRDGALDLLDTILDLLDSRRSRVLGVVDVEVGEHGNDDEDQRVFGEEGKRDLRESDRVDLHAEHVSLARAAEASLARAAEASLARAAEASLTRAEKHVAAHGAEEARDGEQEPERGHCVAKVMKRGSTR
ncbi:hypothetical protein T492DRAFT_832295 [Pavlovales sp. CCMP2436]|nr:hypothetical protein T492DRAFT_832295 [Pavlovales sp. CCMP2436]